MAITNEIQCAITYARSPRDTRKSVVPGIPRCCLPPFHASLPENEGVLSRYLGIFAFYLSRSSFIESCAAAAVTRSPVSVSAVLVGGARSRGEAELRRSCERMAARRVVRGLSDSPGKSKS